MTVSMTTVWLWLYCKYDYDYGYDYDYYYDYDDYDYDDYDDDYGSGNPALKAEVGLRFFSTLPSRPVYLRLPVVQSMCIIFNIKIYIKIFI